MEQRRTAVLPALFLLIDVLVLTLGAYIPSIIWTRAWSVEKFVFQVLIWLVPLVWITISFLLDVYSYRHNQGPQGRNIRKISLGFLIVAGVVMLVIVFGKFRVSRGALSFFLVFDWLALLTTGFFRNEFLEFIRSLGYMPRHVTFVGSQTETHLLQSWIDAHPEKGFQKSNFILYDDQQSLSKLQGEIRTIAEAEDLEDLTLGSFHESSDYVDELINLADEFGVRVFLQMDNSRMISSKTGTTTWGPFTVIRVRQEPLNGGRARLVKRGVDLLITIPVLIFVYWWFYALAAILIKTSSKGPAVFIQKRIGKDGEPFNCYKFRTMKLNQSRIDGKGQITQAGDKRITWIGRILRATNLDELPQFINVLKGEMSVAGPRPHMVEEDETVSRLLNKYKIRRFVKPGITGWAAVNGYRGGTEDMELMQTRIDHDIYYIENWSPWLDTKIFFMTVWKMLTLSTGGT